MSGARPLVVVTEELDAEPFAWLAERCEVVRCPSEHPDFAQLLARAQALIVRTYSRVDEALLVRGPALRVVGRAGVGLDNIDVPACAARGVAVVSTPGANTRAVVEFVLAGLLDATRPREPVRAPLGLAEWKRLRVSQEAPIQLAGAVLGVVGLGRIGSQVARAASALEMRTIYADVRDIADDRRFGAEPVGLLELAARARFVTVHVDGRSSNRGLIGREFFDRLAPGAVVINTSRGFVLDPSACAAWLLRDGSARALLDVHEPEPIEAGSPLLGLANATLTPHLAGGTRAAKAAMSWVVLDVWRVLGGGNA